MQYHRFLDGGWNPSHLNQCNGYNKSYNFDKGKIISRTFNPKYFGLEETCRQKRALTDPFQVLSFKIFYNKNLQ